MNALEEALGLMPPRIENALKVIKGSGIMITEIRLRRDLPVSVSTFSGNLVPDESGRFSGFSNALCASQAEISYVLNRLCEGSVYRYMDTLKQGFLVTPRGVRAGLCGTMLYDDRGNMRIDLDQFRGINLRIPHPVQGAADELLYQYRSCGVCPTLIYSPPGVGKTTLVRDLALRLSAGALENPFRVAVVDERRELFPEESNFLSGAGLLDVLSGYPKAQGIEIATRLFSPEILICDEIGGEDDPGAILSAQNSGVIFVATAHAATVEQLLQKPKIKELISGGIFSLLCGMQKKEKPLRGTTLSFRLMA